jgi:hypothetical protein
MEGVQLFVLRVYAIPREAPAQAVGPIVHNGNGFDDLAPVKTITVRVDDSGNSASGWDSNISLPLSGHFVLSHSVVLLCRPLCLDGDSAIPTDYIIYNNEYTLDMQVCQSLFAGNLFV